MAAMVPAEDCETKACAQGVEDTDATRCDVQSVREVERLDGDEMTINVGFVLTNGLVIAEPFDNYEHLAWWLSCPRCHSRMFATTEMIEENNVPDCKECAAYARLRELRKNADELLQAGRGDDAAYNDIIEIERSQS
jgi:hypothetical protein